jgi:uncharacterized membrane protein YjjB (DUF3815 family)
VRLLVSGRHCQQQKLQMTLLLVIAAIYAGLLFATCLVGTVIYDLYALRQKPPWRTVSGDFLRLGSTHTWIAVLFAGMLGFAVGCLTGHLYFPQLIAP